MQAAAEGLDLINVLRAPKAAWAGGAADAEAFGDALGALWEARGTLRVVGSPMRASAWYIKMPLTYAFEQTTHWVNLKASMYVPPTAAELEARRSYLTRRRPRRRPCRPAKPTLVKRAPAAEERRWATAYCLAYAGGSTAAFAEVRARRPSGLRRRRRDAGEGRGADAGLAADAAAAADGDADADDAEAAEAAEADEAAMMAALARRVAADAAGSVLVLVGWSMGGMLAAELALHLHAAGTPPQLVHVAGRMAPGSFVEAGADVDKSTSSRPRRVKASAAWKEWLLPLLNADLRADAGPSVASPPRGRRRRASAGWWRRARRRCSAGCRCARATVTLPSAAGDRWLARAHERRLEAHTVRGGHEILQRGAMGLLRLLSLGALLPASPLYRVAWAPLDGPAGAGAAAVAPAAAAEPVTLVALDPSLDAAADGALLAALGGAHGLFVRVAAAADPEAQRAQCWALLRLVQRLAAAGGGGRLVLLCAAEVGAALAAGASKAVPLEFPELSVQPPPPPAAADLLRQSGPLGALPAVRQGWLSWLSAVASAHAHEADVWLAPEAPHAAPRLGCCRSRAPSRARRRRSTRRAPTSSPVARAASAPPLSRGSSRSRVPPHQIVLLSRRAATLPVDGVRCVAADLGRPGELDTPAALAAVTDVRGIFHLAGVLDDGLIVNMTEDRLAKVVAPRQGSSLCWRTARAAASRRSGCSPRRRRRRSSATPASRIIAPPTASSTPPPPLARPPPPTPARRRRRACWPSTLARGVRSAWRMKGDSASALARVG